MPYFYLADEKHKAISGAVVELKKLVYFKHDKAGYDGKATKEHVRDYPDDFENFRKANPEYVVHDTLVDMEIGYPSSSPHVHDADKSHLVNESGEADALLGMDGRSHDPRLGDPTRVGNPVNDEWAERFEAKDDQLDKDRQREDKKNKRPTNTE